MTSSVSDNFGKYFDPEVERKALEAAVNNLSDSLSTEALNIVKYKDVALQAAHLIHAFLDVFQLLYYLNQK